VDTTALSYGEHLPDESELRLCGDVQGRRVLELGVTAAWNSVQLARKGARAIAVDPDASKMVQLREMAESFEVAVECRTAALADLGFATSASVDIALCLVGLEFVEDVPRLFRQVHRVLKTEALFVIATPHPFSKISDNKKIVRSYWDSDMRSTVSGIFTALRRASFEVDALLEPPLLGKENPVPSTLVIRAKKLGI
jgi:SAM-dependent methyltransferase